MLQGIWSGAKAGLTSSFMRSQAGAAGYLGGFRATNMMRGLAAGRYGAGATGAFYGGLYGAGSGDTSVLGGAMMGGGIGTAGRLGLRAGNMALSAGIRAQGAGYNIGSAMSGAFGRRLSKDMSVLAGRARNWGTTMYANTGNRLRSTMKGWRS